MPEFTGERVVPGFVDADLFNEHMARYRFAARLASGRRVLDAGCGSGYGSAELARVAGTVTAIDFSAEAISYASEHFHASNLSYQTGDCLSLPDGPFDLIVAFEVIEHLAQWQRFLEEARRTLAPGGLFVVSTPNKLYYAESRGESGDNPFHVHEFEYQEFRSALEALFPNVVIVLQNHVEGVAFSNTADTPFDAKIDATAARPEDSHFFLAVSGAEPLPPLSGFVWIPGTGNILREREHHIHLLTGEVALKTEWLAHSRSELDARNSEYDELLGTVRRLNAQIEERNKWAIAARQEAGQRATRIVELQEELAKEQAQSAKVVSGYEAKLSELEETNRAKTEWAIETERRLTQEIRERSERCFFNCVAHLDRAEQAVVERTLWGTQNLQHELDALQTQLATLRSTNWMKAGAKLRAASGKQIAHVAIAAAAPAISPSSRYSHGDRHCTGRPDLGALWQTSQYVIFIARGPNRPAW